MLGTTIICIGLPKGAGCSTVKSVILASVQCAVVAFIETLEAISARSEEMTVLHCDSILQCNLAMYRLMA